MSFDSDTGYVPDTPSFAIFFLLKAGAAADWVRLWSGEGDYALPADSTDTTGGIYLGLGFPVGLPSISQAINGAASSLEFTLSGVDATAVAMAGVDRHIVDGSMLYVGIVDLDDYQAPVGACDWLLEAMAGKPRTSRTGQGAGAVRTITLPASTDFYDRNLSAVAFWSPTGQRARSADDSFFDQIPTISAGMIIEWPA